MEQGRTQEAGSKGQQNRMTVCYMENHQQEDPPPIAGATSALHPHNFSHQKYEKKSLGKSHNFSHRKYSKKSACLWVEKISEKICGKMFRGKRKAPNLEERGQGAKIRKSVFVGKDSGIIRECKMRVLSFCFRTKEPCLCLVGRCLYDLPSFGT